MILLRRRSFGICRQAKWSMTSEAKSTRVSTSFRSPLIRAALRGAGARHRSKVGALPARLSGARHLLAAPDTGAGNTAASSRSLTSAAGRLRLPLPKPEASSAPRDHSSTGDRGKKRLFRHFLTPQDADEPRFFGWFSAKTPLGVKE